MPAGPAGGSAGLAAAAWGGAGYCRSSGTLADGMAWVTGAVPDAFASALPAVVTTVLDLPLSFCRATQPIVHSKIDIASSMQPAIRGPVISMAKLAPMHIQPAKNKKTEKWLGNPDDSLREQSTYARNHTHNYVGMYAKHTQTHTNTHTHTHTHTHAQSTHANSSIHIWIFKSNSTADHGLTTDVIFVQWTSHSRNSLCWECEAMTSELCVRASTLTSGLPSSDFIQLGFKLSWNFHVDFVCNKASKSVGCLVSHFSRLSLECIRLFYKCHLLPISLYGATAWHSLLSKSAVQTLGIHHERVLNFLSQRQ